MTAQFLTVGDNAAAPFGTPARARARALAANAGLDPVDRPDPSRGLVVADLAYAWDPAWLRHLAANPGHVLVKDGHAVLGHVAPGGDAAPLLAAMAQGRPYDGAMTRIDADGATLENSELRKREQPFVLPLDPADPEPVERAAYDASYKGVTDALTLYVWRRPAFHLTRWAARAGMRPNQVTLIGFLLCVAAFFAFRSGHYAAGFVMGFGFMVLDTVDGKLARCTGQSSKWGNIFDHGVDLIHPPFWYWAWIVGLGTVGLALEPVYAMTIFAIIFAGYVAQRIIEGLFIRRFKIHIHVWRPFDSRFRLVTARRNPNMALLGASLLVGRPDWGIQWVALWTLLSFLVHAVRLAQANARADRGHAVKSWLS